MRQVFFDPFGRYTEGYNLGMQQEQNLQHNVRQARQADWDFNVMNPYRLANTQRQDILGAAALPYQIQLPALGLDEAKTALATHQLPLAENWFRATGMASPWAAVYGREFGMTPTSRDASGNINYSMRGPNGEQENVGSLNPQVALNQLYMPQQLAYSEAMARNNYYNSMAQYGRTGPYGSFYDYGRGMYYLNGGPHGVTTPAQGSSPVDRFFASPTQQQPQQQPQSEGGYNLAPSSGGINYGAQTPNADYGY